MWLFSDFNPVIVEDANLCLAPGSPHEVPEDVGQLVLAHAGDLVRRVEPVYWDDLTGHQYGPAVREYLGDEWEWSVITCEGTLRFVPSAWVKKQSQSKQKR